MINLNLEDYHNYLKIRQDADRRSIYDPVRKKYVTVQPEELVRQSWIAFLHQEYNIPHSVLAVEKSIILNGISRRYDLVYFNKARPFVLFEFKSFNKALRHEAAFQAAQYNLKLEVPYIVVSNGIEHHAFKVDHSARSTAPCDSLDFLFDHTNN